MADRRMRRELAVVASLARGGRALPVADNLGDDVGPLLRRQPKHGMPACGVVIAIVNAALVMPGVAAISAERR